ncbi:MAG: hypothetical protein AABM42_01895 [Actinomycetota bacterium]
MNGRVPDAVYVHDPERARQADHLVRGLCEARGLDEFYWLALRLVAVCKGGTEWEALCRELAGRLAPSERKTLLRVLLGDPQ